MEEKDGKILQNPKAEKSEKLFIDSVTKFNQSIYSDFSISQVIEKTLEIYIYLPNVESASLFYLDQTTFEFYPGHVLNSSEETHKEIFDLLVEKGLIAESLDKGEIIFSNHKEEISLVVIPVISPNGIMGIIQLVCDNNIKLLPDYLFNYVYLHANQFSFLMTNARLNKEINNLEAELEQKISLRVEKIKQAQRELQLILDSILTGVFIIEKSTGTIINVNDAAADILKTNRESIIGTKRNEWEYYENIFKTKIKKDEFNKTEESFLINADKKEFPVLHTLTNLFIGNTDVYVESFIDISERKKYETDLKKQANLLIGVDKATNALLVESNFNTSINKAIEFLGHSTNVERVYIYKNISDEQTSSLKAERIYSWKTDSAKEFDPRFSVLSYNKELKEFHEIFKAKNSIYGVVNQLNYNVKELLKKIGIKSLLIAPLYVENNFWGFLCFDHLTEEKEWSESEEAIIKAAAASIGGAIERQQSKLQLLEAIERAEKADRSDKLKSEFLAQMSHEIRTPINSMLSFTSILKQELEENLTDELKSTFDIISKAGFRIIRTVDLILNMSELQTGVYELVKSEFDIIEDILLPIYNDYYPQAKTRGINFSINNYCENTNVISDIYSVTQIFSNIIDNAFKYTEKGSITINVVNKKSSIAIEVADTGIGISSNYMSKIFEPFSQEDKGYTRKYEGNGLGLALVKKYCDLNDIKIEIESRKGVGSKFITTFP